MSGSMAGRSGEGRSGEGRSGDGFLRCSDGAVRWGVFGAAGVVFVLRDVDNEQPFVMLQKRSAWAHEGGTWSCAGGAIDEGESPYEAALREASEEVGEIPAHAQRARRVRVRARHRLAVHHARAGGAAPVRWLHQLRDRCRRVGAGRRGGSPSAPRRLRCRLAAPARHRPRPLSPSEAFLHSEAHVHGFREESLGCRRPGGKPRMGWVRGEGEWRRGRHRARRPARRARRWGPRA